MDFAAIPAAAVPRRGQVGVRSIREYRRMLDLFDVPWSELSIEALQRFLVDAEDEPLQWEAKGTKLDGHAVRKAAAAFANSHDGGFLILGAGSAASGWQLDGVAFPEEPRVWLSSTVRDGLRPTPDLDVHAFATTNGHVAVMWVAPLADPPCITRGTVYERVPGQSVPVKDPQRLAALYTRGDQARVNARDQARTICDELAARTLFGKDPARWGGSGFRIGLATVGQGVDVVPALFSRKFTDAAIALIQRHINRGPVSGNLELEQTQTSLWVEARDAFREVRWALLATWDGAVALACNAPGQSFWQEEMLVEYLVGGWTELLDSVRQLGGHGDHCVSMRIKTAEGADASKPVDPTIGRLPLLQRGPVSAVPDAAQRARLVRELKRIAGYQAFEDD